MDSRLALALLVFAAALASCQAVPTQYPPASTQDPPSVTSNSPNTQIPQVSGSQRWQYAWNKAMEGIAMGGTIAGPYGAGGGLVIGLLTGLFTADSHFTAINNQIAHEQQKDQQLEAAIEQELERQRGLDSQVAAAIGKSTVGMPADSTAAQEVPLQSAKPIEVSANVPKSSTASLGKPASYPPRATSSPFRNVEVRDMNGDGIPDLWIYYNPQNPGEIVRQEESTKGDGHVDSWSYFKDGQLVRRDLDTRGDGRPDTVYYFDNDKIAREERDEMGRGIITYRAIYQNGRLAKVEKDSAASGRPDLWIYYDAHSDGEVVAKEERDLTGDGLPDLWTYYENGRVSRRDVSAAGMEILTRQDSLPAAPAAPLQPIAASGS